MKMENYTDLLDKAINILEGCYIILKDPQTRSGVDGIMITVP